jgi:Trk K+ transport system NAD-binding subunit
MASFGTDYIVDPFDTFALHLATALDSSGLYLLTEWLTGVAHSELTEPVYPPTQGAWVVCGYGRFGKAIYQRLKKQGLNIVVVEAMPDRTGVPETRVVTGRGTEAETLQEAGLEDAVGLVAGTDNDANNLSIVMTARAMSPDIFVVARQNHRDNQALFDAVKAEIVMHPSAIIANRIRVLLTSPMLHSFLQLAKYEDEQWACQLISRVIAVVSTRVPDIWEVPIDAYEAAAVTKWLKSHGGVVTLGDLLRSPSDRTRPLPAIALMIQRGGSRTLLPDDQTRLKSGDRILWCGRERARRRMAWTLHSEHLLFHAVTGETRPEGAVMQWLAQRRRRGAKQRN